MNYIETVHEYVDEDGDTCRDVWFAVRPTPSAWTYRGDKPGYSPKLKDEAWVIQPGSGSVAVWDIDDIAGIRKLLDAIEAKWVEEQEAGEGR